MNNDQVKGTVKGIVGQAPGQQVQLGKARFPGAGGDAMKPIPIKLGVLAAVLWVAGCTSLNNADSSVASPPAGSGSTYVWSTSLEAKRASLERASQGSGIVVLRTPDNQLQVNVPSDFSFDPDSAEIKPGMRPVLDEFADDLKANAFSRMVIHVVGFADSRGADAANKTLSLARASNVRKYLEGRGIAGSRIEVEGRGESQPLVSNDQPYGRALNRRVEIYLREPAAKS